MPATVVLTNAGPHKIQVIKVVRAHTRWGLREAKDFVDHTPSRFEGMSGPAAETFAAELRSAGANVEIEGLETAGQPAEQGVRSPGASAGSTPDDDVITKLERLSALHASGALEDQEFRTLKARLIAGDQ